MDFKVLGPLEVQHGGVPVTIGSRMQRRLLALLLIHAGSSVRSELAIEVLWEGVPPPSASAGLQTYVSRLRRLLGDGAPITSDANGYRLHVEAADIDAQRFERQVAAARDILTDDPASAVTGFAEALDLWRGPAYAEFAEEGFAQAEVVRLEELRLSAVEEAFTARLTIGDPGLISDLEAFTTANPLRERPHLHLMTALDRAGRPSEALEVFHQLRRSLSEELGLEPSEALQQRQNEILRRGSDLAPADERRGPDPPGATVVGNLPRAITSFIGREHETGAVGRLLERGHLVTLTGVGGVGKTRLALEAATAAAHRYPDGVWWCELAPVDPDAVDHAVATVLDVHPQANLSIADSIVRAVVGKRLLLVLDNCEHLVGAAARLVERLLANSPTVTVLATSREPLAVAGEQVWAVPPLPLPSGHKGDGADAPSAQLFSDRAIAHRADFAVDDDTAAAIADICRQLDGLPLAIELAAALVPALETSEIARRLSHRFRLLTHGPRTDPRHRSLSAVVEWSYQLLEPPEQRLFERLAVFSGGFTLTAAEGVCADEGLEADRIAGLLTRLVSHSMVGVDRSTATSRYHMLETLRQYAGEQLAQGRDEPGLRQRHAAWFVELAEQADIEIRGPDEAQAVERIESELANLRAAHRWAVEQDEADLALRQAASLYVYARFRLRDEVFTWAERAAELPSAAGHALQPMVWGIAAHGMSNRGELRRARDLANHAIAAAEGSSGLFVPLRVLATTALHEGRLDDCRRYTREAMEVVGREGDAYHLLWMQMHEVLALAYGGDRSAALQAAREQQADGLQLGNPTQRAWALYGHAEACGDEDPETALRLLEEAIALAAPVRSRFLECVARVASASLLARHRAPREALSAFPEIIRHWHRVGDWTHQWTTIRNLVPLLVRLEADEAAALLYGAQRRADTAAPVYGTEAERLAEAQEVLATRLGTATFEQLVERGAGLREDAVDLAIATIEELLTGRGNAVVSPRDGSPSSSTGRAGRRTR